MTFSLGLLLISATLLTVSVLLLCSVLRSISRSRGYWIPDAAVFSWEEDDLALEIGGRIFSGEDWEIVRSETTPRFARGFRDERIVLALEWLCLVRRQVRRLVRDYRRLARFDVNARAADELAIAAHFLFFELTVGILCGLIWIHGPSNVAKLLAWSLDSARKVRRITRHVAPDSSAAASGIISTNS
jgi:hypothetical protein